MAYIAGNEKLQWQDPNQQQQPQQPTGASGGGTVGGGQTQGPGQTQVVGGERSQIIGGPASTAGIGAGGTGGWTNIQSYLNANRNDNGSATALNQKVSDQFGKEKTQLQTQADNLKSEAQKALEPVNQARNNFDQYLNDGGGAYRYEGEEYGPVYQKTGSGGVTPDGKVAANALKSGLTAQYSGPSSFNYGFDTATQNYGSNLADQNAFNRMMGDLYQEKSGGKLSAGGRMLQTQLDVDNEALAQTRQNLLNEYAGLGTLRDQTVTDTTKALADAQGMFTTAQGGLRDLVSNKMAGLESTIGQQESDAKSAFETLYRQADSDPMKAYAAELQKHGYGAPTNKSLADLEAEAELVTGGLKGAEAIAKLKEVANGTAPDVALWGDFRPYYGAIANTLDSFYQNSSSQYGNAADAQERQWNFLADVLGSTSERKKKGFNFKG